MKSSNDSTLKEILTVRWKPGMDLAFVALTWLLVTGALYTATFVIGQEPWGGMGYFLMYAVVCAALCGVGLPLLWTVAVRKRPIADVGLTTRRWKLSLAVQIALTLAINVPRLAQLQFPDLQQFIPLAFLGLTIGFFEAVFWRGWVQLRLEEAFGVIPAIVLASALYSVYHIGYGMPASELVFLFFVGLMFAAVFRITKSILILWPLFQPMGQLITLLSDPLSLPLIAALGFAEAFALMLVLVWLAHKYFRSQSARLKAKPAVG